MYSAPTGQLYEGGLAKNEEHAIKAVWLHNFSVREEKREAKEAERRKALRASITLPKLKFMGEK
jgi:hypothetical protein